MELLNDISGRIRLYKGYIEEDQALLSYLLFEIPWTERDIKIFGKIYKQPRLLYYMGDPEASYIYIVEIFMSPRTGTSKFLILSRELSKPLITLLTPVCLITIEMVKTLWDGILIMNLN